MDQFLLVASPNYVERVGPAATFAGPAGLNLLDYTHVGLGERFSHGGQTGKMGSELTPPLYALCSSRRYLSGRVRAFLHYLHESMSSR